MSKNLNWNGRSYADLGNGADINPSTALIIEMVVADCAPVGVDMAYWALNGSYMVRRQTSTPAGKVVFTVYQASGSSYVLSGAALLNDKNLHHLLYTFESGEICAYTDGSNKQTATCHTEPLTTVATDLLIAERYTGYNKRLQGQLPFFKMWTDSEAQAIIDGDLAGWVAAKYATAKRKFNL